MGHSLRGNSVQGRKEKRRLLARPVSTRGLRQNNKQEGFFLTQRNKLPQNKCFVFSMQVTLHACSVAESCLTLCDPTDCSPPASSVHGILQATMGCHVLQGISPTQGSSAAPALAGMRILLLKVPQGTLKGVEFLSHFLKESRYKTGKFSPFVA